MTTAPDQLTFDQILEQTFPKDIQQKRIRKELISLNDLDQNYYKINLQNSSLGLKVVVEFTELFIQQQIQQNSNLQPPIILELLLDPQFPFNLPKLFCRTNIFQPSLADGRDFLEDAIERPWSPTILLREVITSIPTFLKKINRLQDPADSQKMGQYYIGDLFSLEDMLGYETVNLFTGEEVIEKKSTAPRYVVVAESHFLKFETADNSRNTLRLLTWANLNSIANIKRSKDDERSVLITFLDKEKTNGISQLMLLTKEASRLEELLLDLGERYGAKIKQGAISDFDLTPYTTKLSRQITEKNVEEALEDIHQLETRLEIEVTKDLVYTLMAFYQKTVEHFANYDDPLVDEFVSKLRSLMEREDVQTALKNNQENEERKKTQTQTLTKQKTIDTDIEDEEEKKESNEPYSWQDQDDNNASIGGDERVVISQSQKLEVQRPVAEEIQNQPEDEWKEYESKGTEEAEKEPEFVEYKPQEEVYEAQENIENRQEEQFVEAEPQAQVQEQQEEYIPAQEEAQVEQKWQEEEREVVENQEEFEGYQENKEEGFEGYQENKEEGFEGYQQEQQQAQEFQQEVQEENQQYVQEVQEEQAEAPIQQEEEVAVQYEEPVQQYEEPVVQQYEEPVVQQEEEVPVQQEEEVPVQQYEEPIVQQEEVVPEQKEEEIQREEQQEEVQVQENKEEEAVQENQAVIENEEKREETIEENQVEEQTENIEAKVEEEVVPEPVEEKEEVIENQEVQVQENQAVIENEEKREEAIEEQVENKPEEEAIEQKEETKENQEEVVKAEENQEEQSPEKAEAEAPENEGEEETQGQEQGEGEGSKKNKKKKNKKKK